MKKWNWFMMVTLILIATGCGFISDYLKSDPVASPTPEPIVVATPDPKIADPLKPLPTRPSVKPTPAPTPENTMMVCVRDIPKMTEENKDQLNKQCLFCCVSGEYAVGVYHRYLQPGWPHGEWWPVWKIEGWYNGQQIAEFPIKEAGKLNTTAKFLVDWRQGNVTVKNMDTGDIETLIDFKFPLGYRVDMKEDEGCAAYGWHSKANATMCK